MMFIVTSLKSRLAKKEFKSSQNGANFCVGSLATNKVAFDKESGAWVTQSTCFLDFIAFDYNASKLEHAQVGDIIAISGELAQENYQDSAGNPRTSYKIIIKDLVISPKQSAQAPQARQNFAPQAQPQDVRSQWAQAPQPAQPQPQPAQLPRSAQVKRALSQRPAQAPQAQNFDNLRPGENWDKGIIDDNFPNDDDIPF